MCDETNLNPAVAAIEYALDHRTEDPMMFLHYWMYGDFDVIRQEWPDAPESVFRGAEVTKTAVGAGET